MNRTLIRTFTLTYQVPLHDTDGDTAVEAMRARIAIMRTHLLQIKGFQVARTGGMLNFSLRVAGTNKTAVRTRARGLLAQLVGRIGLDWREVKGVDMVKEKNSSDAWWGDQLDGYATESP